MMNPSDTGPDDGLDVYATSHRGALLLAATPKHQYRERHPITSPWKDRALPTSALIVRSLSAQASLEPHTFTAPFTVGRSPDSDVQIVHPLVSRTHLLVTPTPTGWTVSCQGRNGMLVNGTVTREALITQGTRIQLGDASGPALGLTPIVSGAAPHTGAPAQPQSAPSAPFIPSQPSAASAPQVGPLPQASSGPIPTTAAPTQARPMPQAMGSASSAATYIASGSPQGAPSSSSANSGAFPSSRHTLKSFRISSSGTIGRAPDNTLVLDDPLISKHHARIDVSANGMVVTDLGSTNGIYVGGQRVPQVQVTQPVLLGLGSTFVALSPDGLCEVQVAGGAGGELVGKDLTFRVNNGSLTLLDGISFSLPGNELLAVVGPSGAGKSTLLKALTGEQKAQEGQVLFNGLDVYEHYPVMRNKIGVVPQSDVIHSALTVRKTLEYAAELRFAKDVTKAERRQRIAEVLEDLDLTAHVDKRVKKLSGGQRKRVSTAIELLTRPSLLFLDEPTSGLDPQLDRDVMDLLASVAAPSSSSPTMRTISTERTRSSSWPLGESPSTTAPPARYSPTSANGSTRSPPRADCCSTPPRAHCPTRPRWTAMPTSMPSSATTPQNCVSTWRPRCPRRAAAGRLRPQRARLSRNGRPSSSPYSGRSQPWCAVS